MGWGPDGEGGKERGRKMVLRKELEKNKRVVLKMHDETGRCRYWRAPRPRPRPHRRQKMRRGMQIVKAALSYDRPTIYDTTTGSHTGVASVAAEFAQESGIRRERVADITG